MIIQKRPAIITQIQIQIITKKLLVANVLFVCCVYHYGLFFVVTIFFAEKKIDYEIN